MVRYYEPKKILELGASFGITTAYMAKADPAAEVYTIEGAGRIAEIAEETFQKLNISNVKLIKGNFDNIVPGLIQDHPPFDLVFIDGNHQKESTLHYFKLFSEKIIPSSILIFDDIHWSKGMEEAWMQIKEDPSVTLTIDLFFMGLVFFNSNFKVKQDFIIRY